MQRSQSVLKDHLYLCFHIALFLGRHIVHGFSFKYDTSVRLVLNSQQDSRQHRLATARLSDDCKCLALFQLQRDMVDYVLLSDNLVEHSLFHRILLQQIIAR